MGEKNTLKELKRLLSDTEGKYWDNMSERLQKISGDLAVNLTPENFEGFRKEIENYKKDEKVYYYFFGLGVLSCTLKKWADKSWAEQCYQILLHDLTKVDKENDRATSMVGNYYWPGVIDGFPTAAGIDYLPKLYNECLNIIEGISDESMKANAIAGIAKYMHEIGDSSWIKEYFEALVNLSKNFKEVEKQAEALVGLIRNLGKWTDKKWASELLDNLLEICNEFSEKPESSWGDSPRVTFIAGILESIAQSKNEKWIDKILPRIWINIEKMESESEKAKLFENVINVCIASNNTRLKNTYFKNIYHKISSIKDIEVRSDTIGKIANKFTDFKDMENLEEHIDKLINLSLSIKSDEYRVKALAEPVYSVGLALANLSDQEWARRKYTGFLKYLSSIHRAEEKANFLGNLIENLKEAEKPEWAYEFCKDIIHIAKKIRNEEYKADAFTQIAEGLKYIPDVSWIKEMFEEVLASAKQIEELEFHMDAVYGSNGILDHLMEIEPRPEWALNLFKKAVSDMSNYEPVYETAFSIGDFTQTVIQEAEDPDLVNFIVNTTIEYTKNFEETDCVAEVLKGLVSGVGKIKDKDLKKTIIMQLVKMPRNFEDDRSITLASTQIIEGGFGVLSDIREEPWIKEAFYELLENADVIEDDTYKTALIAGQRLEVSESIAQGLENTATSDWKDYYLKCFEYMDQLSEPDDRFYAFINFCEIAVGDMKINDGLKNADWLSEFVLMCLDKITSDYSRFKEELSEENIKQVNQSIAKMTDLLERRIEAERPEIIPAYSNQSMLFGSLIQKANIISEDVYSEKEPFSENILFEISPRTSLLCTLARDFIINASEEWKDSFLTSLIHTLNILKTAENKQKALAAIIESISHSKEEHEEIKWLNHILDGTTPGNPGDNGIRLSIMRSFIRVGNQDSAMKIALEFSDPATRIQALRELSVILEKELPEEVKYTLEELTNAESRLAITKRLLANPDYKDQNPDQYEFDVAISCAGVDRPYAEKLVKSMEKIGIRVFYDRNYEAHLWGENLYQKLFSIFSSQALYCLVFISKNYTKRKWALHELEAAQSRQLESKEAYILPLRLDDTELPDNILKIHGYLSLKDRSYDEIAGILAEKISKRRKGSQKDKTTG